MGPIKAGGCRLRHGSLLCLTGQKPLLHDTGHSDRQGLSLFSCTNTNYISTFNYIIFQVLESVLLIWEHLNSTVNVTIKILLVQVELMQYNCAFTYLINFNFYWCT